MAGEVDEHTANTQQAIILAPELNLEGSCQQTGREAFCRDSTFLPLTHWGGEGMALLSQGQFPLQAALGCPPGTLHGTAFTQG